MVEPEQTEGPISDDRLPLRHALVLGAVQGPTELLPVSSSGHLALLPSLCGWRYAELDPELRKSFEVALHAGTAAALLLGLRAEVRHYVRHLGPREVTLLGLSFTPAALAGYHYERQIEQRLGGPRTVAIALVAGAIAMDLADRRPERRDRHDVGAIDALVIGLAQACALVPGVSRNGATLAAARLRHFTRGEANAISRHIALPVIVGAAALKSVRLARRKLPGGMARATAVGSATACASTLVSLRLIGVLERSRSLRPYALYRLGLGATVLAMSNRHNKRGSRPPLRVR